MNNIIKTPRITGLLLFSSLLLVQLFLCGVALAETKYKQEITLDRKTESATEKEITKNAFQDWSYQCGGEGLRDDECFIMQDIFKQESGFRLLRVAVGYLGPDGSPLLLLTTPLGIFLPAGIVFNIVRMGKDGEGYKTQLHICMPAGCRAIVRLDKELIWAMEMGSQIKAAYLDNNTGKKIIVEVSLAGFTKGLEVLSTKRK